MTRPDPPVRSDGRCVICHGPRGRLPKTATQRAKAILAKELALDPFDRTECCREWFGTQLAGQPEKAPPSDMEWSHT